jgi:hypothetical protein
MNVKKVAAQGPEEEYLFRIFDIGSLQCMLRLGTVASSPYTHVTSFRGQPSSRAEICALRHFPRKSKWGGGGGGAATGLKNSHTVNHFPGAYGIGSFSPLFISGHFPAQKTL